MENDKLSPGIAVIIWSTGGYSEALIMALPDGELVFCCANWVASSRVNYITSWENFIDRIITDPDEIAEFLSDHDLGGSDPDEGLCNGHW